MNNKLYDILKWIAIIGLSGLGFLVNGLGEIWKIPFTNEIVKSIDVVGTALGIWLSISAASYNKKKGGK